MESKSKNIEIERKWLVDKLPSLGSLKKKEIVQGYIVISNEGKEVRLRKKNDQYFLTVKGAGGLIRSEREIELTSEQFKELWPLTEGMSLSKDRYEIPYNGLTIELDVYGEEFSGLLVAEVEFKSIEDADNFKEPEWFSREITEDKRYKNKVLAFEGLPAY